MGAFQRSSSCMPHHGFTELHQIDTFYNSLTSADQDSLSADVGGNLLTKTPKDSLTLIENKSKFRTSRNRPVVAKVRTNTSTFSLSPDVAALTDVCLITDGNAFPGYQDNIQAYVTAAAINYNQGNARNHPSCVANQVQLLGFSRVQNNQNRGINYNSGNSTYRASTQPTQVASSNELTNYMKVNDTNMRVMQNQINNMKTELELKDLPSYLEYAFLVGNDKLPIIIAKNLKDDEKECLIKVLKSHKQEITWKLSDIKGIDPQFCTHNILMEDEFKPTVQHQKRVNQKIHEVIKKEVIKILDAGLIYPISDSPWVSPVYCVPKKGGMTVVTNEDNVLIPTRLVTRWRVCIDYRKLNDANRKDHFPLPFMDQMLERLAGNEYYCFLDGFSGYFQIPIDPQDQKKTTFTCHYGTFAYRHMPFDLCNARGTFQRCMMAIFHDMIKETIVKNLAVDHFSRLENPYQSDPEKKEITKTGPLETVRMVTFHGDSNTPWFADIANYHAGNFIVKGMSSQQKKKFFKDVKHYF
nr:reverse transcriptase domain-containing protein [Tanacetum cinerariifolium]